MDEVLGRYYEPSHPGSYGGVRRLYDSLKGSGVKVSDVKDYLSKQNTYTLHKDKPRRYPRNRIVAIEKDHQWAADLADMSMYARENNGYKFILTVIDVFSKYLWLLPLKNKKPDSVRDAFVTILKTGRIPMRVRTDRGNEFKGSFDQLLKDYDIEHLWTQNKTYKAATAERVQRTLKNRMFRFFTRTGKHRYIDNLNDFVDSYNNSYHRSIKMTPNEALKADRQEVFRNLYGVDSVTDLKPVKKPKLRTGDIVRVAYDPNVFDKGYWHTHSDVTGDVVEVFNRPRPMYALKDYSGRLNRHFYEQELQRIAEPSYRIEKVLKRRTVDGKPQYYVKFIGYPSSENAWVDNIDGV